MTTKGKYLEQGPPSVGKVDSGGDGANPGVIPETPKEQGWWKAASPWVHGVLGVASFVPGLSVVTGAADAAIYAAEGNMVEAGIAAASMIPGGKVVTTAGKVGKAAVGAVKGADAAKAAKAAKEAADGAKAAKEAADAAKAAKEAADAAKATKEAADAAKAAAKKGKKGDKNTTVKSKKPKKRHRDCGKVGKYSTAPKEKGKLNADHIPSGAALKKAAEKKLIDMGVWNDLTPKQQESVKNSVYNNAPTISIPEDVHKEGRTWGSKNNPTQIENDSKDLKTAFEKDAKAIQKSMDSKDPGCSGDYKKAVKELRKFDFDDYIEKTIKEHKAVKVFL